MAQTILGIDIGSYSVKVAKLTRYLKDFELLSFHEQVLPTNQRLTHEEALSAALRSLFEKNELTADFMSVGLPANHVSCRVLELPFTNAKKIEQTFSYELESFIPVPLEELLVDYHILSIEENRSTLLASYISRSRFLKYYDLLQVAGIDPKYLGVDSIDLSNIAQIAMVPQEGVYAILDIGHQKSNICIMKGQKLQYVRSMTLGGLHFTRAIQKAFKLNFEKAEALKFERGHVRDSAQGLDQISRLCQKVAEELVVAIKQTYMGFKQMYPEAEWNAIYVTGGGARLAGLPEMLSHLLKVNVLNLDFLDFIPHKVDHPETTKDLMAPVVSQTMRVIFSNRAVKISFRRGEFAYKKDIKALGGEIKQLLFWCSIIVLLGIFHFLFSYYTLGKKITAMNEGIAASVAKNLPDVTGKKAKSTKDLMNILNGRLGEITPQLEALAPSKPPVTGLDYLLEFSKKIPAKSDLTLDVDVFAFTGDHIRIDGRTNSFEAVDKIKNALTTGGASSLFKNVTTQNVVKGIRDEIKFSISMDVGTSQEES